LERKPPTDIRLPEKIATRSVTAKSLGKGTYQKALLAAVAPILIPDMVNAIRRNLHLNDMQAAKLTAEIFGMAGKKDAGIVLNVNQQNNNVAESHAHRASDGPRSFEDIQSILEEEEKRRKAIPASFEPVYDATPDSLIE
jgi:hypothetical protein